MPAHLISAGAYHGPPELTVARAFSEWTLDPWALIVIVVAAAAYLTAVRRVRRTGQRWGTGRIIAFCGVGLGTAVIATMSFVGVYWAVLFYARGAQTVLLLLVVPLFLALGRPITLIIAAWPAAGARIERAIGSRAAKIATFPAITTLFRPLGRPIPLIIAAGPAAGARIERATGSRTAKIATFPAITTMFLVVTP